MNNKLYEVLQEDAGKRLDIYTTEKSGLSRSLVQKLIKDNELLLNGNPCKSNSKLEEGDRIAFQIPEPTELEAKPQDIPLEIIYQDEDIAVVNKPQGMVVHPAAGNYDGTMVNALLFHLKDLSGVGGVVRPGIVHRIDKDTSGILVVAKNDLAHHSLTAQIKEHTVNRIYQAVVHGVIAAPGGTVDAPVGRHTSDRKKMTVTNKNARNAVTHFTVLQRFEAYTHIECKLETGRTHQIRVHMQYAGYPVVGDPVYGQRKTTFAYLKGQVLHASTLGFNHPRTGEYMEFSAPLPEYFTRLLAEIAV